MKIDQVMYLVLIGKYSSLFFCFLVSDSNGIKSAKHNFYKDMCIAFKVYAVTGLRLDSRIFGLFVFFSGSLMNACDCISSYHNTCFNLKYLVSAKL